MRTDKNTKNAENKFTSNNDMLHNSKGGEIDQEQDLSPESLLLIHSELYKDRYLPTENVPFKKMLASPENIHISRRMLDDVASYDPLKALKFDNLEVASPYNFKDANQLDNDKDAKGGVRYTEVDFASNDPNVDVLVEMQNRGEDYLDKRTVYNVSVRYTNSYDGGDKKSANYVTLKPKLDPHLFKSLFLAKDSPDRRHLSAFGRVVAFS